MVKLLVQPKKIGLCNCNHIRAMHGAMTHYQGKENQMREQGHGGCHVRGCQCPQFTWKGWAND